MHAVYVLGKNSLGNNELNMCDSSGRQKWKKYVASISAGTHFCTFVDRQVYPS